MNIVFKQHFKVFFKDMIGMDERFIEGIDKCDTELSLAEHMAEWGGQIATELGVTLDAHNCDECSVYENEMEDLRDKLEEFPELKTLDEVRKLEAFMEHHHKYNATEMDELLK